MNAPLGAAPERIWLAVEAVDAYFAERDQSFRVIVTGGEMLHG